MNIKPHVINKGLKGSLNKIESGSLNSFDSLNLGKSLLFMYPDEAMPIVRAILPHVSFMAEKESLSTFDEHTNTLAAFWVRLLKTAKPKRACKTFLSSVLYEPRGRDIIRSWARKGSVGAVIEKENLTMLGGFLKQHLNKAQRDEVFQDLYKAYLTKSVETGDQELAETLFSFNAPAPEDISVRENGCWIRAWALTLKNADETLARPILEVLLEHGQPIDRIGKDGMTTLEYLLKTPGPQMMRSASYINLLIDYGADWQRLDADPTMTMGGRLLIGQHPLVRRERLARHVVGNNKDTSTLKM